jgi:2Fe-2S ferredoxin
MTPCKVTFQPMDVTVEIDADRPPAHTHGDPGCLLDLALASGVEIEHACGGTGVCGTCHVIVVEGEENLSPPDNDELDVLDQVPGNTLESRLACRAVVHGDVTVRVPNWNRNAASEHA